VRENVPLSTCTTFRIGGPARFLINVKSKEILVRLLSALNYVEYPYRIIGGGSNILADDKGFDGVVIKLGFREIVENGNFIYADAGCSLVSVVQKSAQLGLSGLEFACGIPGTVGGAVFGNAGAFGSSMSDVVAMVDVLVDGEIVSLDNLQCKFKYRESVLKNKNKNLTDGSGGMVIIGAYFSLRQDQPQDIQTRIKENTQARLLVQPKGANAGSVFRNPPGQSAGALIDKLGLKGTKIGGAMISEKHANFIINEGDATAKDVRKIISLVKKRVKETYGINLKTEIGIMNG